MQPLNRTKAIWDRETRNEININWDIIENNLGGSGEQSAEALTKANEALVTADSVQQQLNNIVIESGTSDAEVVQARGEYDVLNTRLTQKEYEFSTQLARIDTEKATKEEVNILATEKADKIELNTGLSTKRDINVDIVESDLSQSLRESIAGGSVAVVGKSSVSDINLSTNVTFRKFKDVEFVVKSQNIVDPSGFSNGGYYEKNNGNFVTRADYSSTDFTIIKYNKNYVYRAFSGSNVTFWDKDYNFISGLEASKQSDTYTFTSPNNPNIYWCRIGIATVDVPNFSLSEGSIAAPTTYDYELILDEKVKLSSKIKLSNIDSAYEIETDNKFNKETLTTGGYISYLNGNFVSRADYSESDYINVNPGEVWYKHYKSGEIAFYDENNVFLTGIQQEELSFLTIPNDSRIKKMRMSINNIYINEILIIKTDKIPNHYIPNKGYVINEGFTIEEFNIKNEAVTYSKLSDELKDKINNTSTQNENSVFFDSQYESIVIKEARSNKYQTAYWLMKIPKVGFDGKTILPKLKLTGSSVTSSNIKDVQTYVNSTNYLSVINAGIFDVNTSLADGIVIVDGVILQDTPQTTHTGQYTLGIKANGDMNAFPPNITATNILSQGYTQAVVGFVPIIIDFQKVNDSILNLVPHNNVSNPRQIIGQLRNGDYFVFSCDGRISGEKGLTLTEAADVLKAYDVKFAYNLDGGGSTQTFVGKKRINRLLENRPVPNVIVFEKQP